MGDDAAAAALKARVRRLWVVVNDEWLGPMSDAEALHCTERLRGRLRQLGLPTDAVQVVVGDPDRGTPAAGSLAERRPAPPVAADRRRR